MSGTPLILTKLELFARRRRQLILWRGALLGSAWLLGLMLVVAGVDWVLVLPDEARWALSGVAYLAVLVVLWRGCIKPLLYAPGPRQLARLVEHADPRLREDLLSAVELGEGGGEEDSAQFRRLVQEDVAARMEGVEMERLLPFGLLSKQWRALAAAVLLVVGGCALTGFQLGTLMMRALVPMMNLARVSRFQIEVLKPSAGDMAVPFGEPVPLQVSVSGGEVKRVLLETFTKAAGREVVAMAAGDGGAGFFSASVQVDREDVEYRIRAGDAMTRRFRLHASGRPQVLAFEKRFELPAYVGGVREAKEEHGDLVALEGSRAVLRLQADQPVAKAELRVEQGNRKYEVPLKIEEGTRLVGELPMDASGSYRVFLQAAATGFENRFSPEYAIRAEPDLVPEVELVAPAKDLLSAVNEQLLVKGRAADDVGLAKLSQLHRINEGPWREQVWEKKPGMEVNVERLWDLYGLGAKPGDQVFMKLVAVDLKGGRAESRMLQVTLIASGFDAGRLQALEAQRALLRALQEMRVAFTAWEGAQNVLKEKWGQVNGDDLQRKQSLAAAGTARAEADAKLVAARQQLLAALKASGPGQQSGKLVLLGRVLGRVSIGGMDEAEVALERLQGSQTKEEIQPLLKRLSDAGGRWMARWRAAVEMGAVFVGSSEFDVLAANLHALAQEKERLLESLGPQGDGGVDGPAVIARSRVLLAETRAMEELMGTCGEDLPGMGERLRVGRRDMEKLRGVLEKALAAEHPLLREPLQSLSKSVSATARTLMGQAREVLGREERAAAELGRLAGSGAQGLDYLRGEWGQLVRQGDGAAWARVDQAAGLAKNHGDVEETRLDADTAFVADLRLATMSLQALRIREEASVPAALRETEKSLRLLELGHGVFEAADAARRLRVAEQWELQAAHARTLAPRSWEWVQGRVRALQAEAAGAQRDEAVRAVATEAHRRLGAVLAGQAAQRLEQEMRDRFDVGRPVKSAEQAAGQVAAQLAEILKLLRPAMEETRAQLAQSVPKLHETMAALAQRAEALKEKTAAEAKRNAEAAPERKGQPEVQELRVAQQQLNASVEAVKDAIRAEANRADLTQAEGRERARDGDDALAMLKEPPVRAAAALGEAEKAAKNPAREEALNGAARHQEKLAQALGDLARHYAGVEQGKAEETRVALRAAEKEQGIKEELDARYAKAEQMAELAKKSPQELLAHLEKKLPTSQVMQKELSGIARDLVQQASEKLAQASRQEAKVAEEVRKLAGRDGSRPEAGAADQGKPESAATAKNESGAAKDPASAAADAQPDGAKTASAPTAASAANAANANDSTAANAKAPMNASAAHPAIPGDLQKPDARAAMPESAPRLAQLAGASKEQAPIAQAAGEAGDQLMRAGRHEQRMQKEAAGETLEQLGRSVAATAQQEVPQARQALDAAQRPADGLAAVEAAQRKLAEQTGQLKQAQGLQPAGNAQAPTPAQQGQDMAKGKPVDPAAAGPEQAQQGRAASQPAGSPPAANTADGNAADGMEAGNQAAPGQVGDASKTGAGPKESAQEQVWMARALDKLDAALNGEKPAGAAQQGKQDGQGQQAQSGKPGQNAAQDGAQQAGAQQAQNAEAQQGDASAAQQGMEGAQNALAAAAQAAADAMRASRNESSQQPPSGTSADASLQAKSRAGAQGDAAANAYAALPEGRAQKSSDWGKLPKKMAEELSQGQQESVSGEYRRQIETYYRVIAEKAKK